MTTLDDVTIELMEANSNLTTISEDLKLSVDYNDLLIDTTEKQFDRLIKFLKDSRKPSLAEIEMQRELMSGATPAAAVGGGQIAGGAGADPSLSGEAGGFLGGFAGFKAAGIGIGAGALAGGLGILAGGGAYLLKTLQDLDTKALKENVNNLLSIGESFKGGSLDFLKAGGEFFLVMTGLGLGLIAFSVGQGFAAAIDYFTKDSKFAENIKSNVTTLLSISDEVDGLSGALLETGTFVSLMTGLGAGLIAFSLGSGAAAIADSFSKEGWAQRIKDNVTTLLSISDEVDGLSGALVTGGTFVTAMTGLAAGLIAFSLGSGAAAIADSFSKEGWAQRIKDNVKTLLSISDEVSDEKATMLGKSGAFALSMAGLAAGLAVFSVGQLANSLASTFNSEGWAQGIKDNVSTLLSITDTLSDGDKDTSKASRFAAGLAKISAGLLAFTTSEAIGSLASVGKSILGFFGAESPFDQIMKVAEKAADLEKGASAIEKIAKALNAFGGIKISDIDIDFVDLAENLGKAIPFIDALANGGEVKGSGGWLSDPLVFEKGLLDPSLRVDELAKQIEKVNYVLGTGEKPMSMQVSPSANPAAVSRYENLTTEELILKATQEGKESAREDAMRNNAMNNNVVNNVNNNNSAVIAPTPSPVRQPNSPSDTIWSGASVAP